MKASPVVLTGWIALARVEGSDPQTMLHKPCTANHHTVIIGRKRLDVAVRNESIRYIMAHSVPLAWVDDLFFVNDSDEWIWYEIRGGWRMRVRKGQLGVMTSKKGEIIILIQTVDLSTKV
jgi:hypothetical protein